MALFNEEEYESAKAAFTAGSKIDSTNKQFATWIRKCNAELEGTLNVFLLICF